MLMLLLYIFTISCAGVLVLLFCKREELKSHRPNFLSKLLSKGDPYVLALWHKLENIVHHNRERTFFLFLVHIPSQAEAFFTRLKAKTHDYYHGVNAKMRDKRDFSGSKVSPYMRSMSFRRDGDAGRI